MSNDEKRTGTSEDESEEEAGTFNSDLGSECGEAGGDLFKRVKALEELERTIPEGPVEESMES